MAFGTIGTTISGLAKTATGDVSNFRKVIDLSPSLLQFNLPPQVNASITAINSLGIAKIPTIEQLQQQILSPIKTVLTDLNKTSDVIINDVNGVTSEINKVTGVLSQIDWLY